MNFLRNTMVPIVTLAAALVFSSALLLVPQTAAAAYPTVEATVGGADEDANTTVVVDLPAGITAGELLIIHIACDCWAGQTLTTPAGWTEILGTGVSDLFSYTYTKTASGSEGSSVNITASAINASFAHVAMRISGWTGTPTAAEATGGLTVLNPPNVTASWGSDENLFIALGSAQNSTDSSFVITAAPTNYSGLVVSDTAVTVAAGAAFRELTSASDNPGTMAYSGGSPNEWVGATIVVQPAAAAVALSRPPNNLGLVGYWPMDEGRGTTAGDFSGNRYDAPFEDESSPIWTNGKRGGALNFTSSYGLISSYTSGVNRITVSAWINQDSVGNFGYGRVIRKGSEFSVRTCDGAAECGSVSNSLIFTAGFDSDFNNGHWYTDANTVPYDTWVHVAVTFDFSSSSNVPILYINGVAANLNTYAAPSGNQNGAIGDPLTFGSGGGSSFPGIMDEVRLYNRILGPTEIAALARGGAARIGASSADLDSGSSLEQGLVGHWTFDGKDTNWTSDTAGTVTDMSGSGNTGTMTNMNRKFAVDGGVLGQGLDFDGSDDFIDAGADGSLDITGQFTLAGWINWEGTGTGFYQTIVSKETSGAGTDGYYTWLGNDVSNVVGCGVNSGASEINSVTPLVAGRWYHVVCIHTATGLELYINGALANSGGSATDPASTGASLRIGKTFNPGSGTHFNGKVDDIRVYNRALTPAEAKQLFNLGQVTITQ